MKPLSPLLALVLLACGEKDPGDDTHSAPDDTEDSGGPDDTGTPLGQSHAVVATVNADYTAGALSTVDLRDFSVEQHTTITTDPNVRVSGDKVFVMNRVDNSIRIYEPGSWGTPVKEFAVGVNPREAVLCEGKLFVTLYGESIVGIYDLDSGTLRGAVDISSYDTHGDGTPEASTAVELEGTLYVGLNNLDASYHSSEGSVIAIDCSTEQVTGEWSVGGNADVTLAGGTLVARWGNWYDPVDWSAAIDGEIGTLDPTSGFQPTISEVDLGMNLHSVAFNADGHGVVLATSTDGTDTYSVHCIDRSDWSLTELATVDEFLSDVAASDDGLIWIAARPHWINGGTGGVRAIDPAECTWASDMIETPLPPVALDFY